GENDPMPSSSSSEETANAPSVSSQGTPSSSSTASRGAGEQRRIRRSRFPFTLQQRRDDTPTALLARNRAQDLSDPDNILSKATGDRNFEFGNVPRAPPDEPAREPGAEGDIALPPRGIVCLLICHMFE
ncbi:hypothetical protein NPIL_616001, partial [Nephila pilipes]